MTRVARRGLVGRFWPRRRRIRTRDDNPERGAARGGPPRAVFLRIPAIGIRARIIATVAMALLPALALFLFHVGEERAQLLQDAEQRALQLARAWAQHHSERVREAGTLLEAVAPLAAPADGCGTTLEALRRRIAWPSFIAVVDEHGAPLCATTGDLAPPVIDSGFLDDVFDSRSVQVSEFKLGPSGRSLAFVGRQLPQLPGGVARAAVTAIELADIQRQTTFDAAGADYHLVVLGRTGTILASVPENSEILGTRLGASHPLIPKINLETEGTALGHGSDGVDSVFAFTQLPETGAKIGMALPRASVLGPQERAVNTLLLAIIGVALAATASAWLIGEFSVVRWVGILERTAEAFGRGDLGRRALVPRHAVEFSALASRFNAMAALLATRQQQLEAAKDAAESAKQAVQAANDALERRVEERTAELYAAQGRLLEQERLSALGQLTATVAHELRNPLGAIKNTVFVLGALSRDRSLGLAQPLGRIDRSIARCNNLITGLLDYSRDRALDQQRCQFDGWLDALIAEHRLPAEIVIEKQLGCGGAMVALDAERLRCAIANLIENAVQAMVSAETGGEHRLILASSRMGGTLRLTITDTGPGIASDILPRIFEPLFSTKSFGTGLGLPVAKRIIEQHGGAIAVESSAGTGTIVAIELPLVAAVEVMHEVA